MSVFAVSLFLVPQFAFASLQITEIMYNLEGTDSKREWIEVYNSGNASVDLSNYRFIEGGSRHVLNDVGNGLVVGSSEYVVIADSVTGFLVDWPGIDNVVDSVFSLHNEGELLELEDESGTIEYEILYNPLWGASGDGMSLQFVNNEWIAAQPTPGRENENTDSVIGSDSGNSDVSSSGSGAYKVNPEYGFEFIVPDTAFVDMVFKANVDVRFTNVYNRVFRKKNGWFVWNMGDGVVYKDSALLEIEHVYKYPGRYTIVFEFFAARGQAKPEVAIDFVVAVKESPLVISSVFSDGSVEIENTSGISIDLRDYTLQCKGDTFVISDSVILQSQSSVVLRSVFVDLCNEKDVVLVNSIGDIVVGFTDDDAQSKSGNTSVGEGNVGSNNNVFIETEKTPSEEVLSIEELDSELQKGSLLADNSVLFSSLNIVIASVLLLALGVGVFLYFFTQRKIVE